MDADTVPLRPLTDDLCDNDSFSVYENEQVRPGLIANGYLAATRFNTLIGLLISELKAKVSLLDNEPWINTGPGFLTATVQKFNYNLLKVYPSHYFIPNHYSGMKYVGNDTVHVYCDQLFGSTYNDTDLSHRAPT